MTKNNTFLNEVRHGLSQPSKYLPSHYFYDPAGDKLFQQIMEMPEYYLTDSELEIFRDQSENVIKSFGLKKNEDFELIELGAGDGKKTQHLLKALLNEGYQFSYCPVDISSNSLEMITTRMQKLFPTLEIKPKQGDYFHVLDDFFTSHKPKVILFIGSNLGNMSDELATTFLGNIAQNLKSGEKLLLGLDLIKSKDIVFPAYADAAGITSKFNLNLLQRINSELGGNFIIENFEHAPEYSEKEGIAKSYLKSKVQQTVYISDLDQSFDFDANELIHTEISRKYNDEILQSLLQNSNLKISHQFLDSKKYFADYILTKS